MKGISWELEKRKKEEEKKQTIRRKTRVFRNIILLLHLNHLLLPSRLRIPLPLRNLLQQKPRILKQHRMQGWGGEMTRHELRWNVENASLTTMRRKCKPCCKTLIGTPMRDICVYRKRWALYWTRIMLKSKGLPMNNLLMKRLKTRFMLN